MSSLFKTIARVIIVALVLAVLLKSFIVEAYRIPTSSMEDTLLPGDFIVANKVAYSLSTPDFIPFLETPLRSIKFFKWRQPARFDIITFIHQGEPDESLPSGINYYIKRVIGLPGETITILDKSVFINGKKIDTPRKQTHTPRKNLPGVENEKIFPKGAR
jgi:signal peptidase I